MASLHKDPRGKSPFFYGAFLNADGRRSFKSTKQRDRDKALEICRGWERAARKGREGSLTEVHVRKVLGEIYERTTGEAIKFPTVTDFLNGWIASKATTKSSSTVRIYRDAVTAFLSHLGNRSALSIASMTARDVETFRDEQVKSGKANKTANLGLGVIRSAFTTARKQQLILSNPADAVDMLPENSATRSPFTRQQISDLLRVADAEWQGMILIGVCHGLRLGDAAKLTWADVDLERKSISFFPQKVRRGAKPVKTEIPMHPDVENYLLNLPVKSKRPDAPLFPALSKMKISGFYGLSSTFIRLMEKAGIQREAGTEKTKGKGRQVFTLGFHSFRHTAISEMANSGVSKERRMKLSGHKSNVHERYTHHELETLRKDVESVPSFVNPPTPHQ